VYQFSLDKAAAEEMRGTEHKNTLTNNEFKPWQAAAAAAHMRTISSAARAK
jgi:hypothetical protein